MAPTPTAHVGSSIASLRSLLYASPPSSPAASGSTGDPPLSPSALYNRTLNSSMRMPGRWSDTVPFKHNHVAVKGKNKRAPLPGEWGLGQGRLDSKSDASRDGGGAEGHDGDDHDEDEDDEDDWSHIETSDQNARALQLEKDRNMVGLAERIIYQAGVDDAGEPLLVIAPVYLPPNTEVPHSNLFQALRSRLETFAVVGPYSIVLLPAPTPNPPSTPLLVNQYLTLPRMARKNVKRIWVVGGGWWVRVILTVFSTTLLSGKTAKRKKIVQCPSLSALATEMGADLFTRIEFPPEVYTANALVEPTIVLPPSEKPRPKAFGVALALLMGVDGELGLPHVVQDSLAVMRTQGLDAEGIFRRSPSAAAVKILEEAYDRGHPVTLAEYADAPFIAASLLKLFLRSLPDPLIPLSSYATIRATPLPPASSVSHIRDVLLPSFSAPARRVLQSLASLLHDIAQRSRENLMTADNLVICLAPGLIGGMGIGLEQLEMSRVPGTVRLTEKKREPDEKNTIGGVLKVMIESYHEIFDDEDLRAFEPIIRSPLMSEAAHRSTPIVSIPEDGIFRQPSSFSPSHRLDTSRSPPLSPSSNQFYFSATGTLSTSTSMDQIPTSSSSASSSSSMHSASSNPHLMRGSTLRNSQGNGIAARPPPPPSIASGLDVSKFGDGMRTVRSKASRSEVTVGEGVRGMFTMSSASLVSGGGALGEGPAAVPADGKH